MSALAVTGLAKSFGGVTALAGIDFTLEAGEALAMIARAPEQSPMEPRSSESGALLRVARCTYTEAGSSPNSRRPVSSS